MRLLTLVLLFLYVKLDCFIFDIYNQIKEKVEVEIKPYYFFGIYNEKDDPGTLDKSQSRYMTLDHNKWARIEFEDFIDYDENLEKQLCSIKIRIIRRGSNPVGKKIPVSVIYDKLKLHKDEPFLITLERLPEKHVNFVLYKYKIYDKSRKTDKNVTTEEKKEEIIKT